MLVWSSYDESVSKSPVNISDNTDQRVHLSDRIPSLRMISAMKLNPPTTPLTPPTYEQHRVTSYPAILALAPPTKTLTAPTMFSHPHTIT